MTNETRRYHICLDVKREQQKAGGKNKTTLVHIPISAAEVPEQLSNVTHVRVFSFHPCVPVGFSFQS